MKNHKICVAFLGPTDAQLTPEGLNTPSSNAGKVFNIPWAFPNEL